jgi:hypothetical protein
MRKRIALEKQQSVFRYPPTLDTLKMFVGALNTTVFTYPTPTKDGWQEARGDYRDVNQELRRLVQAWFDSGPNVEKLWSEDPMLARLSHIVRASMVPTKGSRAYLIYMGGPETGLSPGDPVKIALGLFFYFLLNPYNEKLGGPCKHCGKYYVKKTKRQIAYCSQLCGRKHTSKTFIQQHRQREHMEAIERVRQYLVKWATTDTRKGWKEWVSNQALISKQWLSRYEKRGELVVPVKLARSKHGLGR